VQLFEKYGGVREAALLMIIEGKGFKIEDIEKADNEARLKQAFEELREPEGELEINQDKVNTSPSSSEHRIPSKTSETDELKTDGTKDEKPDGVDVLNEEIHKRKLSTPEVKESLSNQTYKINTEKNSIKKTDIEENKEVKINVPTSTCEKCGQKKPISEFKVNKQRIGGLQPNCNACVEEYYNREQKSVPGSYIKIGYDEYLKLLKELSPRAILVLIYLHRHNFRNRTARVLQESIARAMCVDVKTIGRAIKELKDKHWISTERQVGKSNTYIIKRNIFKEEKPS
jgi:hypothetical protein